ncbi:MAG TPA: hypothetical protein VGB94_02695 [Acidobacteriaceae bacterium]
MRLKHSNETMRLKHGNETMRLKHDNEVIQPTHGNETRCSSAAMDEVEVMQQARQ